MKIALWLAGALVLAAAGPASAPASADEPPITIGVELGLSPPADPGLGQLCRRGAASPQQKLSDLGSWYAKQYQEKFKDLPVYSDLNCFGDIAIIAQAIAQAKSVEPKAIAQALETGKFTGWAAGDVTFPRAEGVFWHNWSPPIQILHYTKPNQDWREAEAAYSRMK